VTAFARNDPKAPGEPEETGVYRLPSERLLQDWKGAYLRAAAYLRALGIDGGQREALARGAVERAATRPGSPQEYRGAHDETLAAIRDSVQGLYPPAGGKRYAADGFPDWRLRVALSGGAQRPPDEMLAKAWRGDGYFRSMPPLVRRSMRSNRLRRRGVFRVVEPLHPARTTDAFPPDGNGLPDTRPLRVQRHSQRWFWVALRRRALLGFLVLIPSVVAAGFMVNVLPHQGRTWLEVAISFFFGALFGWISIGFWTALLGFFTLLRRRDRFAITRLAAPDAQDDAVRLDPSVRTAIVMPVCEEPVDRVFAGLKAIYRSLQRENALESFDFFILSDTADPGLWVKEEEAWLDWCRAVNGFGRIFYRRRRLRIERKSGNVADFCRRWGDRYRYMIMLDADSVMSGAALVRLVRMMERRPRAGVIQTVPFSVGRRSLFARAQQFASRVYGPMFAAGLHYWQLGDGQYWGHNAIIRVTPFMEHCALPRLPGKPPLGGEILSHDFVEAALLGRAGWELWLAFDLRGSYEDTSSSLLEEMKRDRRWCQGNLQHLRLFFTRGLVGAHRALFLNGVLSYVSALLWFCFLALSTAEAVLEALQKPDYFPSGPSLFPDWPIWRPDWAVALVAVTAAILFLPKLLSILLILFKSDSVRAFGGVIRLSASVLLEILLSSLFAPIRMVFHTRFVLTNLLGYTVGWRSSAREDSETAWAEALRHHGLDTVVAAAWGLSMHWLSPQYFWWLTPIVVALVLSVPSSVLASRVRLGERARRMGLFATPEETQPPEELRDLGDELTAATVRRAALPPMESDGFVRAVVDPYVNALHRALLGPPRSLRESIRANRQELADKACAEGPSVLTPAQRRLLLYDPQVMTDLHRHVWALPAREQAALWGRPG
jgi:membrane glycosyltransferase